MIKNQEEDEFVAVRVQDPRVQNEGSWNSYVDYKIFLHTNSKAFTAKTSCVRRRYSEFVWLKKNLQKNSGLVPVPDLPGKSLFSFSNEEFLEKRRKGLQFFLDKVLHMTVCLSDSQLHLFLQTQLPVGHIVDCVQGHTPYTVTDAILTYASSNRGWVQAQEEDDLAQEPSVTPVSYESMESPAPHLPTLPTVKAPVSLPVTASESEPLRAEEHVAEIHNDVETMALQLDESEMPSLKSHQETSGDSAPLERDSAEDTTISGDSQGEPASERQGHEEEEEAEEEEVTQTQMLGCRLLTPVEVHSPMDAEEDSEAGMEKSPENEGTVPCRQSSPDPATHNEAGREGSLEEDVLQVSSQEQMQVDSNPHQSPDVKSNGSTEQDPHQEQTDVKEPPSEVRVEAEPDVAIAWAADGDDEGRSETPVEHVQLINAEQEAGPTGNNGEDSHSASSSDSHSDSDIESIQEETDVYMQTALPDSEHLHPDSTEVSKDSERLFDFQTNGEAEHDDSVAEVTEAEETNSYIHLTSHSTEDLGRDTKEPPSNGDLTSDPTLSEVTTDGYMEAVPEEESLNTDWKEVEVSVKQTANQVQNNMESTREGNEARKEIDPYVETVPEEEEGEEEDKKGEVEEEEVKEVEEEEEEEEEDKKGEVEEEEVKEVEEEEEEEEEAEEQVKEVEEEEEEEEEVKEVEEEEEKRKRKSLNTISAQVSNNNTLEAQENGDPTCNISTLEVSDAQENTFGNYIPVPALEDAPEILYMASHGPRKTLELESSSGRSVEGEDEHNGRDGSNLD